jgi:hypothetical protein
MKNTKHQTPNTKHQTPNTKHQTPEKLQTPNPKLQRNPKSQSSNEDLPSRLSVGQDRARFEAWKLDLLWCLELGVWCFTV